MWTRLSNTKDWEVLVKGTDLNSIKQLIDELILMCESASLFESAVFAKKARAVFMMERLEKFPTASSDVIG